MEPSRRYTWGIDNQKLSIQSGQIITEAVLTFHNFRVENYPIPSDWNQPNHFNFDEYTLFSRCWLSSADNQAFDLYRISQLSQYWLKTDCGDCGGGDLDGDGDVGPDDLMIALDRWLAPAGNPECVKADWTNDRWVDEQDLMLLAENWLADAPLTSEDDLIAENLFCVHLLNNPRTGLADFAATADNDPFAAYGSSIHGVYQNGSLSYRLSQNQDSDSPSGLAFDRFVRLPLADGTTAVLTSALLELIDNAGSGAGFGFGFCPVKNRCLYDTVTLDLTVQSYLGVPSKTTLQFTPDTL